MDLVLLLAGFVLLTVASDHFVRGAVQLARALRVAVLVVGIVVVGFGTSLPEALVTGLAGLRGEPEVGVGNVVGSNIANLSLLLGAAALVRPLAVSSRVLRVEAPRVFLSAALFLVAVQGGIGGVEALGLGAVLVVILVLTARGLRDSRGDSLEAELDVEFEERPGRPGIEGLRIAVGLGGTMAGAHLLLEGATGIAETLGLTGGFVGLTLVAAGTSLPELATVVQASRHGEPDLVVGNLLGSNVFNSLFVAAVAGAFGTGRIGDADLTLVGPLAGLVLAGFVWLALRTGWVVTRTEGAVLVVAYAVFIALIR